VSYECHPWLAALAILAIGGGALSSSDPAAFAGTRRVAEVGIVRSMLADVAWLSADLAWERRDRADTRYWLALTVAADPAPEYFWLNSARIIAYDLPSWDARGRPSWRSYRQRLAAREALGWLGRGLVGHPHSFALEVEMGNIAMYGLGDRRLAAIHYGRAAGCDRAEPYAGRIARGLQTRR
jgi:hypothetical protein